MTRMHITRWHCQYIHDSVNTAWQCQHWRRRRWIYLATNQTDYNVQHWDVARCQKSDTSINMVNFWLITESKIKSKAPDKIHMKKYVECMLVAKQTKETH